MDVLAYGVNVTLQVPDGTDDLVAADASAEFEEQVKARLANLARDLRDVGFSGVTVEWERT